MEKGGRVILSILTPAVPSRLAQVAKLCAEIERQAKDKPVEHLVFSDNKKRSIGKKRDNLLRLAKGRYVAFVDDDDEIMHGYVDALLEASKSDPDVITFGQEAVINGVSGEIEFRLGNPNEAWTPGGKAKRNAWHVCAWKRTLAVLSQFPDNNYGEDWVFASKLCAINGLKSVHVDKVLHRYIHSLSTTEAPPPLTGQK